MHKPQSCACPWHTQPRHKAISFQTNRNENIKHIPHYFLLQPLKFHPNFLTQTFLKKIFCIEALIVCLICFDSQQKPQAMPNPIFNFGGNSRHCEPICWSLGMGKVYWESSKPLSSSPPNEASSSTYIQQKLLTNSSDPI